MSDTTIDTLVLDIQASSGSASLEIEKLASSLEKLKNVGRLTTVTNNLKKLSEGLNSLKMSNEATHKLTELTTSLAKLKESTKGNSLGSILKNLQKLPEITKQIKPEVIKQFASYMNQLSAALGPLSTQINNISSGFSKMPAKLTQCVSAMGKMEKSSKSLKSRLGGLGSVLQGFLGITFSGFAFGQYLSSSISSMNSFVENTNYSNQVMGDYAKEAQDYAFQVQEALNVDAGEFMRAQSTFMALGQGFGLASDKAYTLSKGMTELAYDMSSFFDEDISEVFVRLQSAISGEIEPVRRWGVALDQASMKQWMLKNGIDANINSLTQADKALIRYNMTVETMAKQGAIYDLTRTLSSPANALRVLQQQFTQLSRAIGSLFIPILIAVLPYVQALVKVLTSLISALAKLVGFEMPEWTSNDWAGLDNLSSSVEDTNNGLDDAKTKAKEFKKQLMGFDELNIISKPTDNSSGNTSSNSTGSVSTGIDPLEVWDAGMLAQFESKVDELVPKMQILLGVVGAIGAGFLAWKIGTALHSGLQLVQGALLAIKGYPSLAAMMLPDHEGLFTKLSTISTKLSGIGTSIAGLPAPIKLAVVAAVLLVAAFIDLYKNSETFRNTVTTVLNEVKIAFQTAWNTIWTYGIQPLLGAFGITAGSIGELYTDHIRPVLEKIGTFFVQIFGTVITTALNAFSANFILVTGIIKGLLTGDWSQAIEGVKGLFNLLPESVKTSFTNMITGAQEKLGQAKTTLSTATDAVKTAVVDKFTELKTGAVNTFENLKTGAKGKLDTAKTTLGNAANAVKTAVQTKFSEMKTNAVNHFTNFASSAKTKLTNAKTTLGNAANAVKTAVQDKFSAMKTNAVDSFSKLKTKAKEHLQTLKTTIASPINGIIGGIEKMANGVIKGINGMVNAFNKLKWDIPSWVPGLGGKSFGFNLKTVSEISIPRFEQGGFLEDGLFTMNRGEIAGKFNNGQSVVANNMQIIKGIRDGVMTGIKDALAGDIASIAKSLSERNRIDYQTVSANAVKANVYDGTSMTDAVREAISESDGRGGTYTFVIDMDGEVVAKKVFKVHNDKVIQTGKTPLLV